VHPISIQHPGPCDKLLTILGVLVISVQSKAMGHRGPIVQRHDKGLGRFGLVDGVQEFDLAGRGVGAGRQDRELEARAFQDKIVPRLAKARRLGPR